MKLLAIDPGSTELGLYDGERAATISGGKGARAERLAKIGVGLVDFLTEHGPYDFVVYEEQFSRGDGATRALYGCVGVIECSAINSGAGVMSVPQPTMRAWAALGFIGSRPKKREEWKRLYMVLGVNEACSQGVDLKTQDEYDAACIYAYIMDQGIFE